MNMAGERNKMRRMIGQTSLTPRTWLLIREFACLSGGVIRLHIGKVFRWTELEPMRDRKALIAHLHASVSALAPAPITRKRRQIRTRSSEQPRHWMADEQL
jgi:hypothetical protein